VSWQARSSGRARARRRREPRDRHGRRAPRGRRGGRPLSFRWVASTSNRRSGSASRRDVSTTARDHVTPRLTKAASTP
jgi:hypothetical protein